MTALVSTPSHFEQWVSARGAVIIDRAAWPVVTCQLVRPPGDDEYVAFLGQCERTLERRTRHALIVHRVAHFVEPAKQAGLRAAWELVNTGKLERYCAAVAVVLVSSTAGALPPIGGRANVPTRAFRDEASARTWALEKIRTA